MTGILQRRVVKDWPAYCKNSKSRKKRETEIGSKKQKF